MKSLLTNRKAGVYVLIVSILLQLVSAVNYLVWAPGAGGIDTLVAVSSAGSFADWYQGIVMFGDPSQVPRILSICILALTAVVLLIITGFMGFGKQET